MTRTPWNELSYGTISGSGARKLADSAVAPLVALARGYNAVKDSEGAKALAKRATAVANPSYLARSLANLVTDDEDILVMPWYAMSAVSDLGVAAKSYNTQYRPSRPVRNPETGKTQKYMWFAGERTVLDLHPATPAEWLDSSRDVLVTEGLIKGDSALTALLLSAGVTEEQLSVVLSPEAARVQLNTLMREIPSSVRMPIISAGSVTTWEDQADQWRHIRLADRRVIIAFDGDLAENRMVWRQTFKAMDFVRKRKGQPVILSMFGPEVALAQENAGLPPEDKLGIDDYLSHVGDWKMLTSLVTDQLPAEPQPEDKPPAVGTWRVSPGNDAIVQEYASERNFDGSMAPARWHDRYFVGGRVVSTIAKRRPSDIEVRTGVVDDRQEMLLEDAACEIEVALLDPDATAETEPERYRVVGPVTLLSTPPKDWVKHARQLPNEILQHPHWPPRKGEDWLSAVKAHEREKMDTVIAWNTMGWVPVRDGHPAFIVGQQVLGRTERDESVTRVGVTDHELPGASSFGVIDLYRDMPLQQYKAQVAADVRRVLELFIESGFWKNRSTAVAVLCAMLRPTIPLRPELTMYCVGPKGAGKSYTASYILSGWQAMPGTWTEQNLNGSAEDTFASMEHAVAHSMIWVVDDLAPQVDQRKAEAQEAALSQIIRGVHNNSARRRMDGTKMTQREVANPVALLVITAENPPQVPSIQERIITISVPKGAFNDADPNVEKALKAEVHSTNGGAPARLVAAMIRLWMQDDTVFGATWQQRQETVRQMLADEKASAQATLEAKYDIPVGESARRAAQVASMSLSLQALYELAVWAGIDEDDPILAGFGNGEGSYLNGLYEMAATTIQTSRRSAPGLALVRALAKSMSAGHAHLKNPVTAGAPPVTSLDGDVGGVRAARINESLGWAYDTIRSTWVPQGVAIGYFGKTAAGDDMALFESTNAFNVAKRNFPGLIPGGQTSAASWESVWTEGLASPAHSPRPGANTSRVVLNAEGDDEHGAARISGVPVLAKTLADAALED